MKYNTEIYSELDKCNLHLYNLQSILGKSESTITRMMRSELPNAEKKRIINLIKAESRKGH